VRSQEDADENRLKNDMTNPHEPEDIAADNESSLKALVRSLSLSQGNFKLILARCNYGALRDRMVQRLRELSPVEIRELVLPESVKSLCTPINAALGDDVPDALMVFGLESVSDIETVLKSSNCIREEFSNHFPFPLVLWVNDEVLKKLLRLAPDLESWATSVEFAITIKELIDTVYQAADAAFTKILNAGAGKFLDDAVFDIAIGSRRHSELESAFHDLQRHEQALKSELEAKLLFLLGRDAHANDQMEKARQYYEQSLALWQQSQDTKQYGCLLFYLGLWWRRYAVLYRADYLQACRQAKHYFQQCVKVFQQGNRPDLAAKFISPLGEVLTRLEEWDELEVVAKAAINLQKNYLDPNRHFFSGYAYGLLAEVALRRAAWSEAKNYAEAALKRNTEPAQVALISQDATKDWGWTWKQYQSLYLLLLAKSQQHLDQVQEAISNLENARQENNPQYDPQLYIDILGELRSLYFQQGEYLKAFELKQERRLIKYQYGFQAFAGASLLLPQQQLFISATSPTGQQIIVAQEIAASGREQDVKGLMERIRSDHHKLMVIHGQSGVGKSSILKAGLISALKQQAIAERDALPVLNRYYTNWVRVLGRLLAEALEKTRGVKLPEPLDSVAAITAQLRKNADRNLVTVLIFDQFEEFFFAAREKTERRRFFEFLQECLNIGFVKVILSLREDYLHYLLESERFIDLDAINSNILDKTIRYPLGNFSPEEAKAVIQCLTKRSRFYLQPELIDQLVRDLAGEEEEVRPIELQVVGAQLQDDKITTLEQYRCLGENPKAELVELYLKGVIQDCGEENKDIAQLILYLLTDENNTRPLKTRAELAASLESKADKLDLVLKILVGSGLVVRVPESPADRYQLVHDYLVEFIRQQRGAELLEELNRERAQRILTEQKLQELQIGQSDALSRHSDELFREGKVLDALIEGLRAGIPLKWAGEAKVDNSTRVQVVNVLRQAVYGVRERNRLEGHTSWIYSVSFSPDGKTFASGSEDNTIKVWNLATGKEITTLTGHSSSVKSVSFSPDGKTLASGSEDNTIKVWNLATGKAITTLTGHDSLVRSVSFSPDGKTLASGSGDKTIKVWNLATGKPITSLTGHSDWVNSVSFSPDGKTLASGSGDNTIKVWNLATGKEITTLTGHDSLVRSVSFSPDGKTLASGSGDNTIKVWNLTTGKEITTLTGHSSWVNSVSFSPDGKTLASASGDKTIKVWNLATGKEITTLTGHSSWVNSVSFSPDGKTLASGSADDTIKVWNLATGKEITTLTGHSLSVRSVSFSPDGKTLASGSEDNTIKVWNLATGKEITTLTGHSSWVNSVSFSPDGKMLASGSRDKTIKVWNLATGKEITSLRGHTSWVNSVSFSPDGKTLASGSADDTIKVWNLATGKPITTLTGHSSWVISVSFSPDGKTLASGSGDDTIKVWNLATGKPITTLTGHSLSVRSVSFSPDGKTLASGSDDKTIKVWNFKVWNLDLDNLLVRGCDWVRDYLKNNPNVSESDSILCDGIPTYK
jgi:WD40 repeat protein